MSSVKILDANKTSIINEFSEQKKTAYCTKCGSELYAKHRLLIENEKKPIEEFMFKNISNIPVVSTHSPLGWDYDIIKMVTAQSTTGTGFLFEFSTAFTDLFGQQSTKHNAKLKEGENMCFFQLRTQALEVGANAVIATDVDYSELGGGKGMLMVCMAGTAIHLKNISALGEKKASLIEEIIKQGKRLQYLSGFDISALNA